MNKYEKALNTIMKYANADLGAMLDTVEDLREFDQSEMLLRQLVAREKGEQKPHPMEDILVEMESAGFYGYFDIDGDLAFYCETYDGEDIYIDVSDTDLWNAKVDIIVEGPEHVTVELLDGLYKSALKGDR